MRDEKVIDTHGKAHVVTESDRELAKRVAEMCEDYTHESALEENALRISAYREEIEAPLRAEIERLREALERVVDHAEDWHEHYCEIWGERRKEQQDAILGDVLNARAALALPAPKPRESAEPALEEHELYVYDDAKPLPRCCDTCQRGPGGDNYDECPNCKDAGLSAYRPIKPTDERGPEVGALLWMAEHVMGTDAARTMRGWLDRFRAEGRLVVRDAAGLEIAHYPEEGDR